MTERVIIAGSGGQGIMLLGKVIAEAALRQNLQVTWFPTYGAEVRGGTAYCMVNISSEDISSPYVDKADTLIIMNEASLLKFKHRIKNKGLLLVNSSLISADREGIPSKAKPPKGIGAAGKRRNVQNVEQLYLPFTETAIRLGNIRIANMVAFGAYVERAKILDKQIIFAAIQGIAPEGKRDLIEINKQAVKEGMELAR
jgi:2-oxoglutarate ferredoxin oxidoreductase subunit gamma